MVVGKTNIGISSNSSGLGHSNSHSTSAVNNIGQNVVDFGRSQSPAPGAVSSRSHSPLPRKKIFNQWKYDKWLKTFFL